MLPWIFVKAVFDSRLSMFPGVLPHRNQAYHPPEIRDQSFLERI